jgi:hypothetical protein
VLLVLPPGSKGAGLDAFVVEPDLHEHNCDHARQKDDQRHAPQRADARKQAQGRGQPVGKVFVVQAGQRVRGLLVVLKLAAGDIIEKRPRFDEIIIDDVNKLIVRVGTLVGVQQRVVHGHTGEEVTREA